jgi:hypothetical protein
VDVDGALVSVPALPPDPVEQLAPGQRQPGVERQVGEEVELTTGECHHRVPLSHFAAPRVDDHVAGLEQGGLEVAGRSDPAQDGAHPRHELARREGFRDVVVGAELEPHHAVHFVVSGREHHDGDIARGAQLAAHVEAVELTGEADVEHHELGSVPLDIAEALFAVASLEHPEPLTSEVQRHQVGDVLVVLDDDNGVPGSCHRPQLGTGGVRRTGILGAHWHHRHHTTGPSTSDEETMRKV